MTTDPLSHWRLEIWGLYRFSFFLPVGSVFFPGILAFLLSPLVGVLTLTPTLLVIWSANPLFWMGRAAARDGRRASSAVFSLFAMVASLPSVFMSSQEYSKVFQGYRASGVMDLIEKLGFGYAGHIAWMLCLAAQALVDVTAWWVNRPGWPTKFLIRDMMVVIAVVALAVGLRHWIVAIVVFRPPNQSGGFFLG